MAHEQGVDRYFDANGIRIHYIEWGSEQSPPMLLFHGIARVAQIFSHLAPHFAERYRVIAIDMRGHGDSGWDPQGAYLVEDYAKDVAALISTLGLRDIVVWGNSTGGRVAQVIAGSMPDLIAGVIVEDVGPERPTAISNRRAQRMSNEENGWASIDELIVQAAKDNPRTAKPLLESFVNSASKTRPDGRVVWKRDPAILNGFVATELWDAVGRITAPIIYVLGGLSTIVPPETQARLRKTLPQVQIVTMPGLGHYPSSEAPEAFIAVADEFLSRIEKRLI